MEWLTAVSRLAGFVSFGALLGWYLGSALWGALGLIICEEEEKTRYSNIAQARDKVKNLAHPKWNFRPLPFEQNWIFFFYFQNLRHPVSVAFNGLIHRQVIRVNSL